MNENTEWKNFRTDIWLLKLLAFSQLFCSKPSGPGGDIDIIFSECSRKTLYIGFALKTLS